MEEQSVEGTRDGKKGVVGEDKKIKHSEFAINFPVNINISYNSFSFRPVHHRSESVRNLTEQIQSSPSESNVSQDSYFSERNYETQMQPLDLSGRTKKVSNGDKRNKSSEICLKNPVNDEIIKRTCISLPTSESSSSEPKLSDQCIIAPVEKNNPAKKIKIQSECVQSENKLLSPMLVINKHVAAIAKQPAITPYEPKQLNETIPSLALETKIVENSEVLRSESKQFYQVTSYIVKESPVRVSAIQQSRCSTEPIILEQPIPLPVTESNSTKSISMQPGCLPNDLKMSDQRVSSLVMKSSPEIQFIPLPVMKNISNRPLAIQPLSSPSEPELPSKAIPLSVVESNPGEILSVQPEVSEGEPQSSDQFTRSFAADDYSVKMFAPKDSSGEPKALEQFDPFPVIKRDLSEKSLITLNDPTGVMNQTEQSTPASFAKSIPLERFDESSDDSLSRTESFDSSSVAESSPMGKTLKSDDSPKSCDQFDLSPAVQGSPAGQSLTKLEDSSDEPKLSGLLKMQLDDPSSETVPPDRFTPSPASESNTILESTLQRDETESNESGRSPITQNYSVENFLTQFQEVPSPNETGRKPGPQTEPAEELEGSLNEPYHCPAEESYSVENFLTQFQDDPIPSESEPRRRAERKRYPCECCDRPFSSKRSLRKHMLSHTDQAFVCTTCGRNFPTRTALFSHHRVHASDEKPFVCDVCGEGFAQRPFLAVHALVHSKERPYVCGVCGKGFSRQGGLARHQLAHTGVEPYSCSLCGKGCRDGGALKAHIRTHTGERPHTCEVCNRSFSEKVNLRRHMLTHAKEMRFVCIICEERFYTKVALKAHRAAHRDEKPLVCDMCDARFTHRSGLRIHQATHSGDYRYSCIMCKRGFLYLSGLKVHFRTHSGEGRHQCGYCQKGFADNDALTEHLQTHTGDEKPFECSKCGSRFGDRSAFRRHVNTHVEEKPFSCDICSKQFTYREALERHARGHEGPFSCTICNKEYLYKRSLECHMRCHKEEMPETKDMPLETVLVEAEPPLSPPSNTFILP